MIIKNLATELASKFINNTNKNIFLTGKAGTGKTTFLKALVKETHKKTIIAAPTGIAAINAGGVTLHSLLQLPFGTFIPDNNVNLSNVNIQINTPKSLISNQQINSSKISMIRSIELLIIDEVSMLRADLLDAIDCILRKIRKKDSAFGGIQILFIGDLMQLPPIIKKDEEEILNYYYKSPFFFNSKVLENNKPHIIELETIYRQTDIDFIDLLNNLRENKTTKNDVDLLNKFYIRDFKPDKSENYIYLTTHNRFADNKNAEELENIKGQKYSFSAKTTGDFAENNYPVEYKLELKKDAQVMFLKNDYSGENKYFNGKIGVISSISNNEIFVKLADRKYPVKVEEYVWENKKYSLNPITNQIEEKVVGTFTHYPIKLAWAITIHKSQGLTFDKAIIDMSKAFAPGQAYVALSRLTSLYGLVLTQPIIQKGIDIHSSLVDFNSSKPSINQLEKDFNNERVKYITETIQNSFDFDLLNYEISNHIDSYNNAKPKSVKLKHKKWAEELPKDFYPLTQVSYKFLKQINLINEKNNYDILNQLKERVEAAINYFEPLIKGFSERINTKIKELEDSKGIKKYITELKNLELSFYNQIQSINKTNALIKSAIENTELKQSDLQQSDYDISRIEKDITEKKEVIKSNKEKKEAKIPTKEISFSLYSQGKSIEEISKIRELSVNTIETHLVYYITKRQISVEDFIPLSKVKDITEKSIELKTLQLSPIYSAFDGKYSYSEIRFALAHYLAYL